jgi:hypothetical protein
MRDRTQELRRAVDRAADRTVEYLASEQGRKVRRGVAAAMIVCAPLVFRMPIVRRYPAFRLIELLGGAAAVMELARMIREWEPERADRLEAALAPYMTGNGDGAGRGTTR